MNKMLEEYNKWIDSLTFTELDYLCERSAWLAWQASRAALVVELPGHVNDMDSAPMLYDSIVEQLDELGIRYDKY